MKYSPQTSKVTTGVLGGAIVGTSTPHRPAQPVKFSAAEWRRLAGFYGFIALLHLLGCGLLFYYASQHPALIGLGFAAYMFGLRHAFDADHIAAVDDTVRYLMQKGQKPLGVGFFFSLGHSTIVFLLAVAIALAATQVKQNLPEWQHYGGIIGASVSGIFLWLIGILNLMLLLEMLKIWKKAKTGQHSHAHIDELLAQRGLINRIFGVRMQKVINHSWQMYPLGLLFGLGFDTASEIGLLAMTAGAASGNIPMSAILSLPILFAAGMSLMDTTDGILMIKAYHWAFVNPLRKIFYNLTTTSLSIAVALVIGTIELMQVLIEAMHLKSPLFNTIADLTFDLLGFAIVGLFLLVWAISTAIWKFKRIDERYGNTHTADAHAHAHTHELGNRHEHKHFH